MSDEELGLPFREAIRFLRQKVRLPSRAWTELRESAHARSFVVAGAIKDQLLADFQNALIEALEEGKTLQEFRKDFDRIVAAHGWSYRGRRGWRSGVIYNTNMSDLAARRATLLKQAQDRASVSSSGLARAAVQNVRVSRQMQLGLQQAGFQVADFAVQVGAGQSAILAFTQQGTQLLQFFGPWGSILGAAGAVLGALAIGFMVRAIDTSGILSANPAILTVNLGEPSPANLILTHDEAALGFPGQVSNGQLVGGDMGYPTGWTALKR